MSAWDVSFLAMLLAGAAVATLFVVSLHAGGDEYLDALCSANRRANITSSSVPLRSRRHIIAELAPPAGWRDAPVHVAIVPAPAAVRYADFDGWDDPDELGKWVDVEPELVPVAVPDWPTPKPAVVEPEPVPVVVNRWARFGSLEIRR